MSSAWVSPRMKRLPSHVARVVLALRAAVPSTTFPCVTVQRLPKHLVLHPPPYPMVPAPIPLPSIPCILSIPFISIQTCTPVVFRHLSENGLCRRNLLAQILAILPSIDQAICTFRAPPWVLLGCRMTSLPLQAQSAAEVHRSKDVARRSVQAIASSDQNLETPCMTDAIIVGPRVILTKAQRNPNIVSISTLPNGMTLTIPLLHCIAYLRSPVRLLRLSRMVEAAS